MHPNGLRFIASDNNGYILKERTYYSTGGGFVTSGEAEETGSAESGKQPVAESLPLPFRSGDELLSIAELYQCSIAEVMIRNESCWRSAEETEHQLLRRWWAMRASVDRGCRSEGVLPGCLKVKRRAPTMFKSLSEKNKEKVQQDPLSVMDWVNLYALAVTCLVLLTAKEPQELFDSYSNQWNWKQFVGVSDELANILDKMLLPTPSDRFGSATQVLTALNSPQIQPIPQPPPLPSPPLSPPVTPVQPLTITRSFSSLELLSNAAFVGFEVGVFASLGFAIFKVFNFNPIVLLIIGLVGVTGLIFALYHRWIEVGLDFIIIPLISLGVLYFILLKLGFLSLTIVPLIMAIFSTC
jgi:hypothetical protein